MHKTSILIIFLLFPISSFATTYFLALLETPPLATSELWQNHGGNGGNGGNGH
ncbi:hypothetical protein [Providencia rettgeri]|uniref:hypothetical protein n=1 Tax=Providencia rettgeri TaxID=587 RepID=UPI0023AAA3DE|nr:hypothetical protein [Providencia rettgeri]